MKTIHDLSIITEWSKVLLWAASKDLASEFGVFLKKIWLSSDSFNVSVPSISYTFFN